MKNRIIFAILVGIFYWLSDSVKSSITDGSPFSLAFFGSVNEADFVVRIAIFIFIFMFVLILSFLFLPPFDREKESIIPKIDRNSISSSFFNKLNRILTTNSLAIEHKLLDIGKLMEERYNFVKVIISLEKRKRLEIVNFDNLMIPFIGEKKILNIKANEGSTTISKLIVREYSKEVGFNIQEFNPPLKSLGVWGVINIGIISKKNSKIIGILTVLLKSKKSIDTDEVEILKSLVDNISFFISFETQKKELLKEFERSKKDLEFSRDSTLHIERLSMVNTILHLESKRAVRYGSKLSLLIFEIDNLENIFTAFGEEITLKIKKKVIKAIQKNVRDLDILGIWHDEKFIIIAPETDGEGAYKFAGKLIEEIRGTRFTEVRRLTCSFGISWFQRDENLKNFNELKDKDGYVENVKLEFIQRGEKALETIKGMGGDSISF